MSEAQHRDNQLAGSTAGALAEIARRQGAVIDAALVPPWYWWAVAAAMIVIGAVADYRHPVVLAIGITAAVAVIVVLTVMMIAGSYRGVRVRSSALLGGYGAGLIVGFVWLVVGLTLGCGFGLRAIGAPAPATIATAAGGVALVIGGPVLMGRLRRLMMARRAGDVPAGTAR